MEAIDIKTLAQTLANADEETRGYWVKYGLTHTQQQELGIALSEIEAKKQKAKKDASKASEAPPAKKARPLLNDEQFVAEWKDLVGYNTYADLSEDVMFQVLPRHHTKAGSHLEASKSEEKAAGGNVCTICLKTATWQFPQPAGKDTVYSCDDDKDDVAKMSKVPAAEGPANGVLKWQIEKKKLKGQEMSSEGTIVMRMEWDGLKSRRYHEGKHDLYLPFNAEGIVLLHMYEACWARNKILQIRQKDNCDKCGKNETTEVCRNMNKHGVVCGATMNNKARITLHFKSSRSGDYGYPDPKFFRYHAEMATAGVFKKDIISPSLRDLVDRSQIGQGVQ